MFRLLSSLLLSSSFCAAETADPRLTQILPNPALPFEAKIADTNHDGWPDIISDNGGPAGYGVLFSNLGNRSFGPARITHHLRIYDSINHDGSLVRLDGSSAFHLFFNQSQSFYAPVTYTPCVVPLDAKGHFGTRITLGNSAKTPWIPLDLDNDGVTEFIQQDPQSVSANDYLIFDRQPDGSYLPQPITFPDSFEPEDLFLCDLDGDGDLDLALHGTGDTIAAMERTGPRSFVSRGNLTGTHYSSIQPPADLDGDGLPDFHSKSGSTIQWFRNLGNFTFTTVQNASAGGWADGRLIKITTNPGSPAVHHVFTQTTQGEVRITEVQSGSGTVIRQQSLSQTSLVPTATDFNALALEDLDRDGFPDLLVRVDHQHQDGPHEIYGSRLAVAWGSAVGYGPLSHIDQPTITHRIVVTGDFDGNGNTDVIVGPDFEGRFHFLANRGDGTFLPSQIVAGISPDSQMPAGTYVSGIKVAELDGDAHVDLAIDYAIHSSGTYASAMVIARGDGTGNFDRPQLSAGDFSPSGNQPRVIDHIVDWDGDGWLDAITKGALQKNLGGVFSPTPVTLIAPPPASVFMSTSEVGDLDGDGRPDIVSSVHKVTTVNYQTIGTMGIGYNDGHGGAGTTVECPINTAAVDLFNNIVAGEVKIADFNNDGLPDLVVNQLSTYDSLGNIIRSPRLRVNPAAGSRTPATWSERILSIFPYGPPLDFNGDGTKEFADLNHTLTPAAPNPVISPRHDLLGGVHLAHDRTLYPGDFDGDGDTDFLVPGNFTNLTLVRNPTIEERSGITRSLIAAGVRPDKAGPTADADGDGRDNQTELIFGTDPRTADKPSPNPLGLALRTSDGSASLDYQIPSLAPSLKVRHELEWSADLSHWTPATGLQQDLISQSDGWNLIQSTIQTLGEKGFYRIRGSHDLDAE